MRCDLLERSLSRTSKHIQICVRCFIWLVASHFSKWPYLIWFFASFDLSQGTFPSGHISFWLVAITFPFSCCLLAVLCVNVLLFLLSHTNPTKTERAQTHENTENEKNVQPKNWKTVSKTGSVIRRPHRGQQAVRVQNNQYNGLVTRRGRISSLLALLFR